LNTASQKTGKKQPATPRGPGRPRSTRKAKQILDAATELFTQQGFEATSVDDIAARAGVSKQTVYSHFGSKEDLFAVSIANKCKTSGIDTELIDHDVPPGVMLPEIARRFVQLVTSEEAVYVHALCSISRDTHPELGHVYYKNGPKQTIDVVTDYLAAQHRAGRLKIDDPEQAAWQFLCMLMAETQIRMECNMPPISDEKQKAYEQSCVEMFLRAYAAI
jgi:AcrR family transcriptional regulator